jgi:hypothetical protein
MTNPRHVPGVNDETRCTYDETCKIHTDDTHLTERKREQPTIAQRIIRLPLPDVPQSCGHCGHEATDWPLCVYGGQLNVTCPGCFSVVAPVVAVAVAVAAPALPVDGEQLGALDPPLHEHDGYQPHSHEVRADHDGVERVTT